MFDLIVIGDSVIDTIVPIESEDFFISGIGRNKKLSFPLGEKIPVGGSASFVAGNAANVAVGASRLGLKTAIYTHVGNKDDDTDDDRIISKLKKEKVDPRYIITDNSLPSNHNIILSYKGERTIFTHHQPWKFKLPELEKTRYIYLTSLSPSYIDTDLIDDLIRYLERTGTSLIFQPGTFQIAEGYKKQSRLLSLSELMILNLEEAKIFLKLDSLESISEKKLLRSLADLGIKKVVITNGHKGSFGFDGDRYYSLGLFPAKLVEMTGAGDAFATGVMSAIVNGKNFSEALRWGGVESASVVEEIGSMKGLLTKNELALRLKEHATLLAKEI